MDANYDAVVFIEIDGKTVPAGKLRVTADGRFSESRFQYGARYLERPDMVPLDPVQLKPADGNPIVTPPRDFELFNAIRDAAPDAWGRKLIDLYVNRAIGRDAVEAEYLLASRNGTRVGALRFGPDPSGPGKVLPFELPDISSDFGSIEAFQGMVDLVHGGHDIPDAVLNHLAPGVDLGGARPKATVTVDGFPWLVKFGLESDRIAMAGAEAGCLDLCEMAGISVVEREVRDICGRPALFLKRFDRELGPDGGIRRRHMISGLTLTGEHEMSRGTKGYGDLIDGMRRHGAAAPAGEDLFRRMAMNVLLGNTDDHLRNHAFLHCGKGRYEMSPLYDVTPTLQVSRSRNLFLHLGAAGSGREATAAGALHAAPTFGLERDEAVAILSDLQDLVRRNWRRVMDERGVSAADIEKMAGSFSEADARLPEVEVDEWRARP
jgi:serine/threonine-protein kinase HipA